MVTNIVGKQESCACMRFCVRSHYDNEKQGKGHMKS